MLRESGLRRMRDVLGGHVASGTAPGLVALVGDGTRTHVETFGSVERDTIFRLASLSKPLTAAATMILVEECRIGLDDPVDEWLPELADRRVLTRIDAQLDETVPARRAITVRDLLTQTPGFGLVLAAPGTYPIQTALHELSVTSDGTSAWPVLDQDEWLKRLGSVPLMYQPGERWQYHISSDVLGVLISRVAGQSFEAFLRERLCAPLGMKDTGFSVPADQLHRLPTSYAHDPSGALTVWDSAADGKYSRPPSFQAGGDGLVSTVDDYNAFFGMLLGSTLLSPASTALMTMDHLTPSQKVEKDQFGDHFGRHGGYGFGMAVRTHRRDLAPTGQFGWDGGLGTTAYADPSGFRGILLSQAALDSPSTTALHRDFWTCAYQSVG
ncbi:serine hydrolase [Amycolatopsis sp. YIM 10]|uniref:serine hydrolase domain-containing protein n=1 Tax=Amycolatopsis sp. YIM 10 TaxID=2653857 RepID=UPI0012A959DE|nr:serine hydrolase domain-containing protein [Amycolatopsis sp. YIM 10]QFU94067.1 Esterase EstB [Amycolatopsis sp. YIM 10]